MSGHPLKQPQTVIDDGRPREDNPFESFFGPLPPGLVPVRNDAMYPYSSWALPHAYQGRNYFLASVLDFLITSEDNFLTADDGVAPFVHTDEIHVQWNTFTFNRTMADYEPEYGVPRLVTMESDVHSDSLARRGLAFELEHGFFKTPIGRATYLQNLRQISEACLETTQYGVIYAILTCKNEWRSFAYMHGSASVRPQDVLKSRKQEWAIVNRSEKGLYHLDALIKDKMRERGISPDTWLLAPRTAAQFQMNEFHTEYYRSGARYRKNLEEGANAIQPFRNSRVYEVRRFDADFSDAPKCPLSRPRSIGSYWVLPANSNYITIYDMDTDNWKTLSRADLGYGDGTLLLMRPFETYQMGSGVLLKRGSEFGNTFVGNNDFMLADNATSKTHIGHYTFYHKTVIRRPELCYLAEDIYAEDYIGGEGTKVYDKDDKTAVENDLQKGATDDREGDIIVVKLDDDKVTNPIDISGQFRSDIHGCSSKCFEVAEPNAAWEALKDNIQSSQNVEEENAFSVPFVRHNSICFRGAYCLPETDTESGRFGGLLHPNTGMWGPDVYAGCREARTGNMACLKPTDACNGSFFNCPYPKEGKPPRDKTPRSGRGSNTTSPTKGFDSAPAFRAYVDAYRQDDADIQADKILATQDDIVQSTNASIQSANRTAIKSLFDDVQVDEAFKQLPTTEKTTLLEKLSELYGQAGGNPADLVVNTGPVPAPSVSTALTSSEPVNLMSSGASGSAASGSSRAARGGKSRLKK